MADRGTLERLRILAYDQPDYAESSRIGEFQAYVNPNEVTLSFEVEYNSQSGAGTTNSRQDFKRVKPGDMSIAFFLDGTGANGRPIDVQEKIEEFQKLT